MNKKRLYSSMLSGMLFFLITACVSGSLIASEEPSSDDATEADLEKIREALKHTQDVLLYKGTKQPFFSSMRFYAEPLHKESAQTVFSEEVSLDHVLRLMKVANDLGYKRVVDTAVQTIAHRWHRNNYYSFKNIKFPQLATDLCRATSKAINSTEQIMRQYLSKVRRKVEFEKRPGITSLAYSSDGSKIAVGFAYGGFEIVDTRNNCRTVSQGLEGHIHRCLFCKEDSRLVIQGDYDLKLMDAVQGGFIKRLAVRAPLSMASCAPYKDAIVVTLDSAQICDLETGLLTPLEETRNAYEILFNAAKMAFLYNTLGEPSFYKLFLRDMRSNCSMGFKSDKKSASVNAFDISLDGTYVAGNERADSSDEIKLWDVRMPHRSLSSIALLFKDRWVSYTKDLVKFVSHGNALFVGSARKQSESDFDCTTEWKFWDMREQQLQTLELPQYGICRGFFPKYVLVGSPAGNEMAVYNNVDNPRSFSHVNLDGLFALQAFLQARPIKEQLLMARLGTYRSLYTEDQMHLDAEEKSIVREWDAVAEKLLENSRPVTPDYAARGWLH